MRKLLLAEYSDVRTEALSKELQKEWKIHTCTSSTPIHDTLKYLNPEATHVFEQTLALGTNAAPDPISAAVVAYKQTGTVTNKLAQDILNSSAAMTTLREQTGMQLPDTAAGRRNAVKAAVAQLAQQSEAQKNAVQENGNTYQLRDYSQQQKENWRNSKRIVLYEGIEQFKSFIKNALSGKNPTNKKLYFGAVDSDLASAISAETGVDVEGYNLALGENEIRKIKKDHGNQETEALRGQRAITESDYLSIPNVVQSPDSITLSAKQYEGKPVIEFRKINGNETTVVAAVVSDKRLDLFVQTTFVNKKSGSIATPESEQADSNTPKATGGTAPSKADRADGGVTETGSLATSNGAASSETSVIGDPAPGHRQTQSLVPAPNISISQTPPSVNPDSNASVGAADRNFTGRAAYQDLLSDENSQRDRPGDVRAVEVPKKDGRGRNVSEFVGNAYGAQAVPDNFTATIEELVQDGVLSYDTKTNAESLQDAADRIKQKGMAATRNAISKSIANGKIGDTDIASAMLLFNHYAHKSGQQSQDSAAELFVDLQMMATQTGRDLQLFKLLRKMTPQGQLMAVTKNVDRFVSNVNKGRSKKQQVEVELPKELTDTYMEAAQEAAETDTPENQQRKEEAEQAINVRVRGRCRAKPPRKIFEKKIEKRGLTLG